MTVAFIGHREVENRETLKKTVKKTVEKLIVNENADTFLFGSMSDFNNLCYEAVTELKKRYRNIERIFVRAEFEHISKEYTDYLLRFYEDTFFPEQVHGAGALSYVKRNKVMIDMCDVLVAYCNDKYIPSTRTNSGTKIAVGYARKNGKRIMNLFENAESKK